MCNELDSFFKPIVLVTGFGPFSKYPVNASWEAVRRMNKEELERKHNIKLVVQEIPVRYENVDKCVPTLWTEYKPKLMIHVGVSHEANQLTLEMQACKNGYQLMDSCNKYPPNQECPAEGPDELQTQLNVERICKEFNESVLPEDKYSAETSEHAGRYLCEYIYYTSLSMDNIRTLFVHVPDTHKYSSDQTCKGLERILELCLNQIREMDGIAQATEKMKNTSVDSKCDD